MTTTTVTKTKRTTHQAKVTDIKYIGFYGQKYLYQVELDERGNAWCWSSIKNEPVDVGQTYLFDLTYNEEKGKYTMHLRSLVPTVTPYPPRQR